MVVLLFGVAGVGKTTVGRLLAEDLGWQFYDADEFHPAANIQKMGSGEALTDEDRQPWLQRLRDLIERLLAQDENGVLACSALKKKYRNQLRASADVKFVFLRGQRDRITEQLKKRRGHYFDPKLLDSQFADLEEPHSQERVITIELNGEPRELVEQIKRKLMVES